MTILLYGGNPEERSKTRTWIPVFPRSLCTPDSLASFNGQTESMTLENRQTSPEQEKAEWQELYCNVLSHMIREYANTREPELYNTIEKLVYPRDTMCQRISRKVQKAITKGYAIFFK